MKKNILIVMLIGVFIMLSGCNNSTSASPPSEENGNDNGNGSGSVDNDNEVIREVSSFNVILNDMPILYDISDQIASSPEDSSSDVYSFEMVTNHENVKLLNNKYIVFYPTQDIETNSVTVDIAYQNITQNKNGNQVYEFIINNNNSKSGVYQYNLDINEEINIPVSLSGYKVVDDKNDLDVDTEIPDMPQNFKLPNYNTHGNKSQCENIRFSGKFKMSTTDKESPFVRCLFKKTNTNIVNDYIKLYFTHGNTTMLNGYINNSNNVQIEFWDFDEISNNSYLNYPTEGVYKFNNEINIPYISSPKKLQTVFSNRAMDVVDNTLYFFSPFYEDYKTIEFDFNSQIEVLHQKNNTDYLVVLEKNNTSDKFWLINKNLEKTKLINESTINSGIIQSAKIANNELYFWTGYSHMAAFKKVNLVNNNVVTLNHTLSDFDNIKHWGITWFENKINGYIIYENNNQNQLFKIENNNINKVLDDMSTTHVVRVRYNLSTSFFDYDYATLTVQNDLKEDKNIKLINDKLYVVLTNEYNQEELIEYDMFSSATNAKGVNISNTVKDLGMDTKHLNDSGFTSTRGIFLNILEADDEFPGEVYVEFPDMNSKIMFITSKYTIREGRQYIFSRAGRVNNKELNVGKIIEKYNVFTYLDNEFQDTQTNIFFKNNDGTTNKSLISETGNNVIVDNYIEVWEMGTTKEKSGVKFLFSYSEKDLDNSDTLSQGKNGLRLQCLKAFNEIQVIRNYYSFNFMERIHDFLITKNNYVFLKGMNNINDVNLSQKVSCE